MPENTQGNTTNENTNSPEFERKPLDILMDSVTKKEPGTTNPPMLLPTRRKRSTSVRTTVKQKEPEVVARRNARERRRVKLVNDGFLRLRKHVPTDPKNKKLSKVKTLRSAIKYIQDLQDLLNQASKNSAALQYGDFTKLEVLQANAASGWFPSFDLAKKESQEYKDFDDAFFTPSRILPRAPLQL